MTNAVEKMADNAMRASQGGGQSKMLQYMLARLAQQKQPARSNKEGIGRLLGAFLLPMIAQGAQTWKENYDARGDWKARGEDIYNRWKAGEQLSPQEQRTLDIMRQNYPDRFNDTASGGQQPVPQQPAPQQPAPQGAQPPAQNQQSLLAREIARAANLPNPDWQTQEHPPAEAMPQANGDAFSGVNYNDLLAQYGQQIMNGLQNVGRSPELEELIRAYGGRLR